MRASSWGGRWPALVVLSMLAFGCLGARPAVAAPAIASITPSSGSATGGYQVTIKGSGFIGSGGACDRNYDIWFGTDAVRGYAISPSSYRVLSDSQIRVKVPANFGGLVDVRVYNACGVTPVSWAAKFLYKYPSSQCLSGTCKLGVGSRPVGALGHVGLGFLNGFNSGAGVTPTSNDSRLVNALHPRWWRFGQSALKNPLGGEFGLARAGGAKISLDLTSDWTNWANVTDPSHAATPYDALSSYYLFIYSDVKSRMAAGTVPDYFDVWNEPVNSGTVNQWLSVYRTAYDAIKAADPSAQVVGPSISRFLISSANQPDTPGWDLGLTDVLNWEQSTGVRFAALTYHEDGATVDAAPIGRPDPWLPTEPMPGGYRDYWSPAAIGRHAAAAKKLIAGYPDLAGTQVFVNEYGPTFATQIPGWIVGDSASLESAGADEGMLTCWNSAACDSLWDGLIGYDGAPQMPYWVMMDYSQMSGNRLQASASGSNWYAMATRSADANAVEALIGRADDCFGGQCAQFRPPTDPHATLSLSIAVPWASRAVAVSVQRLPNSATSPIGNNDVATAPATQEIDPVATVKGVAHLNIPSVGDGDALYLVVTPSSKSPPAPPKQKTPPRGRGNAKQCSRRAGRRASRHRPPRCRGHSRSSHVR